MPLGFSYPFCYLLRKPNHHEEDIHGTPEPFPWHTNFGNPVPDSVRESSGFNSEICLLCIPSAHWWIDEWIRRLPDFRRQAICYMLQQGWGHSTREMSPSHKTYVVSFHSPEVPRKTIHRDGKETEVPRAGAWGTEGCLRRARFPWYKRGRSVMDGAVSTPQCEHTWCWTGHVIMTKMGGVWLPQW